MRYALLTKFFVIVNENFRHCRRSLQSGLDQHFARSHRHVFSWPRFIRVFLLTFDMSLLTLVFLLSDDRRVYEET